MDTSLSKACALREAGNKLFRSGEHQKAGQFFLRAAADAAASLVISWHTGDLESESAEQYSLARSNLAQCSLLMGQFAHCLRSCDDAISACCVARDGAHPPATAPPHVLRSWAWVPALAAKCAF